MLALPCKCTALKKIPLPGVWPGVWAHLGSRTAVCTWVTSHKLQQQGAFLTMENNRRKKKWGWNNWVMFRSLHWKISGEQINMLLLCRAQYPNSSYSAICLRHTVGPASTPSSGQLCASPHAAQCHVSPAWLAAGVSHWEPSAPGQRPQLRA